MKLKKNIIKRKMILLAAVLLVIGACLCACRATLPDDTDVSDTAEEPTGSQSKDTESELESGFESESESQTEEQHECTFEMRMDDTKHYLACSVCGEEKDRADHVFDNACDADCNVCGYTRTVSHSFEEKYDESQHYSVCSVCGEEKDRADHVFDNACDTSCNKCGYVRTTTHKLGEWSTDSTAHWKSCSECKKVITYSLHTYDNACDATCNTCGYTRVVSHNESGIWLCDGTYHWKSCSACGETVLKSGYTFGSDKKCTTCGFKSGQPCDVIDKLGEGGAEVSAKATILKSFGADGNFNVAQGACTDGKYVYIILENQNTGGAGYKKESHYCKIYKIDLATCKIVKTSEPILTDHGNDCAYNSRTGQIVVCHNAPNKKYLTFVDAETLTVVKKVTDNKLEMFAVAYNANYNKYVVGIANYYDYGILSASLAYEKRVNGTNTGYTKQGIDCDDKYIYLLQYNSNVISVHDWDGNYVRTIKLTNVTKEPEAIFHIGDDFYMTSYAGSKKGAILYKLTLEKTS